MFDSLSQDRHCGFEFMVSDLRALPVPTYESTVSKIEPNIII